MIWDTVKRLRYAPKRAALIIRTRIREIRNQPFIHVFGDSHSLLFQHPVFKVHYCGPATAYNLGSPNSTNKTRDQIVGQLNGIKKKDTLLFVFGEIDARIHIYKTHKEKNMPLKEVIDKTVERYLDFVDEIHTMLPQNPVIVFNILPAGEQENKYGYTHYADYQMRSQITKDLNSQLQAECKKKDIKFLDIFSELITEKGTRKKELIFDDIHYSDKIVPNIIKWINKNIPQILL